MFQIIRRDPSGSRFVEKIFTLNLTALVKRYQAACNDWVVKNQGRQLEVTRQPISARDLILSVQRLAGLTIMHSADTVAEAAAVSAYQHGVKWADKALSTRGVINPTTNTQKLFYLPPERAAIDRIKARNMMEIQGMTDELAKRMSRSLVDGFEKSETMNLLIRRVKEETDFGIYRAQVIARTETMRAINGAAKDRYKQNGVERVEWLSAWDDRTCDECESLNGKIFDMGEAPDLPVHPQCRCTLAPVIGEKE